MYLSICVPSYNRPKEIERLLESIDCKFVDLEICICENHSPKMLETRKVVENLSKNYPYIINYYENEYNYGYDKNIREVIKKAKGKWIIIMSDDDIFIPNELDKYIKFLKRNEDKGYILRSYRNIYKDGSIENFRYYEEDKFFEKGEKSYVTLYRKSTFISGFTIQKEFAIDSFTDCFDSTLLYQLYIVAEITLNHPSAYYSTPFTQAFEGGEFYFGDSEVEKEQWSANVIDVKGQAYFIKSYFTITEYIDNKYSINSTEQIKLDMSKYSYPILAFVRKSSIKDFKLFKKELEKIGINNSKYFYFYYYMLFVFGEKITKKCIKIIKKLLGKTPKL